VPAINLPDDELAAVKRQSVASSPATDILMRRVLIRCAPRWRGSTRLRPQAIGLKLNQLRRPRRRPRATSGGRAMVEDATPLVEVLVAIIEASRAYLPGEMSKDEFVNRVLEATDNPKIIAALVAHGHSVVAGGASSIAQSGSGPPRAVRRCPATR
jgi:hypothetical protein